MPGAGAPPSAGGMPFLEGSTAQHGPPVPPPVSAADTPRVQQVVINPFEEGRCSKCYLWKSNKNLMVPLHGVELLLRQC